MNDRLSQQRADAVREYYVASGVLNPEKVVAIGYGAKRPLAPNDTPEGRAINRRIDVLIRPVD
jgi:flagellar motor protein MotB